MYRLTKSSCVVLLAFRRRLYRLTKSSSAVFLAFRRRLYRLTKSSCLSGFTSETVHVQTNQSSCLSGFTSETAPVCRLTNRPVLLALRGDCTCVQANQSSCLSCCMSEAVRIQTTKSSCLSGFTSVSLAWCQPRLTKVGWLNLFNAESSPKMYCRGSISQELGEGVDYSQHYTVTTRKTPALRWAAVRAILTFQSL